MNTLAARRQRGVALAFILWMLAGLSLLVAGVVSLSLSDVKATGLQLDQARAEAAAAGAAHLALRDMRTAQAESGFNPRAVFTRQYRLGEAAVTVRALPIAGFVGLNQASAGLLQALFQYAGGLAAGDAEALAQSVLEQRSVQPGLDQNPDDYAETESPAPFMVVEDLLRVPGMTRSVYDRVRHAVHAQAAGGPGVDPLAAQAAVLQALAQGDPALVDFVLDRRQDDSPVDLVLPAGFNQEFMASGGSGMYSLEIDVRITEGRLLRQRIWVDMGGRSGVAPWRFTRVFPVETTTVAVGKSQ
ncbi:type II secretion system protein GspK [Haliea sp. E1-2-M8]|uniref:type II secretion system protein GspK n=1 Tax=Haliea sp. E1-2-M8 TaxID=3064706 RepID=UPI00271DB31B|nr:type II secretion system protein GspK [Haliea sp. E1-2-M8]MDO8862526.1 type II secretion system protein GspK [Haliea sp. E1-2-M8]